MNSIRRIRLTVAAVATAVLVVSVAASNATPIVHSAKKVTTKRTVVKKTTTTTAVTAASTTKAPTVVTSGSIGSVAASAKWASNVTVKTGDGYTTYSSNGLPNHARQAEYALPNQGVRVPSATTAYAAADPTKAQNYSFKITTSPRKAATTTSASLGSIGIMISGATLFNPYEGDGTTVATASNFTVKNAKGESVAFLDSCSGHPTPMGQYHYHALPACVTAQVDTPDGPSHIIGLAFDGFPIYGDRDIDGKAVKSSQLDACNGITSTTPEYPSGVYHYVLLATSDSTSSIRCFSGTVDSTATAAMPGM